MTVFDSPEGAVTVLQADLYRHAAEHGVVNPNNSMPELQHSEEEIAQACASLQRLRLLVPLTGHDLAPIHPSIAAELLNQPLKSEIRLRQQMIEGNERLLRRFAAQFADVPGTADITVIHDPLEAVELREATALGCTDEVLIAQLGVETGTELLEHSAADYATKRARGVNCKLIFQHVSRSSLGMRGYFRAVQKHGVAVSTSSESFDTMSIYDRRTAFIPLGRSDGSEGSVMITNGPVVQFLCRFFERLWAGAMPFEDADSAHEQAFSDDRLLLLRLLAAGLKDDAIANRLGIAVRTCRRYVANVLVELGATSRFQAGVRVGQLGLLPLEPPPSGQPTAWVDVHPLS